MVEKTDKSLQTYEIGGSRVTMSSTAGMTCYQVEVLLQGCNGGRVPI